MSDSEAIASRLKVATLPWISHISKKKMFGGLSILLTGKMCVGETKERLLVVVKPEKTELTLAMPRATPKDFTGNAIKESVFIAKERFKTEAQVHHFIEIGIAHTEWKLSQ